MKTAQDNASEEFLGRVRDYAERVLRPAALSRDDPDRAGAQHPAPRRRSNGGGWGPHRLDERLVTKVASGEALSAISRALLITRSGRGLGGDDTAQLHARSVLFVRVRGQTADVRRAQLAALPR
ncbi:hypothetical protein ACFYO7_16950 [Nocardia salmonicida]|uniref:hypothetical protein n=1 Tax=Nocardia salmonicida TaxID=53431 RepID=UPI00369BFA4B